MKLKGTSRDVMTLVKWLVDITLNSYLPRIKQ